MNPSITNYLQRCEQLAQENKPIPKLALNFGNSYESAKDVAQTISGLLETDIPESAINLQSSPCSPITYCNSSYGPVAPHFPEIAIIRFYYQSNVGFFKAERFDKTLYFYSPLYLSNPEVAQNNKYFKWITISSIIALAILISMIFLFS